MRQVAWFVVLMLAGAFVALFPTPPPAAPSPTTVPAVASSAESARSVAICPWLRDDGLLRGSFRMAAPAAEEAAVTVPLAGVVAGERLMVLDPFTSTRLSDLVDAGTASGLIEFDGTPAATVAVAAGDGGIVTVPCRAAPAKVWLLAGGSTLTGETLELRLFNAFPQDARISIRVTSENDLEPESTLESLTVSALTTRVVNLGELLALRQVLAFSIADPQGLVVPALIQSTEEGDTAGWTGVEPADRWEFPFTNAPEVDGTIVLVNDESVAVSYEVDVFAVDGAHAGVLAGSLEPRTVAPIAVEELTADLPAEVGDAPSGVVVRADGRVGAFLIGAGTTQRAAMAGSSRTATGWLLPGPGPGTGRSTAYVLNSATVAATVTYQQAGPGGSLGPAAKIEVAPGTVATFPAGAGAVVRSTEPVSVAWIAETQGATSFTLGVPFDDG